MLKWSDEYATGIARIDEQHQMLFRMAEDFREALDEGRGDRVYESFLESLALYARSHFRFEEGCMDRCRCPAAATNKTAHDKFVEVVTKFSRRYAAAGFYTADARDLTETIDKWLTDHIVRIDLQLKGLGGLL